MPLFRNGTKKALVQGQTPLPILATLTREGSKETEVVVEVVAVAPFSVDFKKFQRNLWPVRGLFERIEQDLFSLLVAGKAEAALVGPQEVARG